MRQEPEQGSAVAQVRVALQHLGPQMPGFHEGVGQQSGTRKKLQVPTSGDAGARRQGGKMKEGADKRRHDRPLRREEVISGVSSARVTERMGVFAALRYSTKLMRDMRGVHGTGHKTLMD